MDTLIYLDTHLVVWLYQGELSRLSDLARDELDRRELLISPAVVLELEFLHEVGRLTEHANPILESLHTELGLRTCDLDFRRVVQASLDLTWTRDPFDRLITGHAMAADQSLLTRDATIRKHVDLALW